MVGPYSQMLGMHKCVFLEHGFRVIVHDMAKLNKIPYLEFIEEIASKIKIL